MQATPRAGDSFHCFRDGCRSSGEVAHFAAGARFGFAVEMEFYRRVFQDCGPIRNSRLPEVTEQIRHGRWRSKFCRTERKTTYGAHLLLKLAGDAGVDSQV